MPFCASIGSTALDSSGAQARDFDPTEWEIALVSTPSTNISSVNERQLVGPSYVFSEYLVQLNIY